MKGVYRYSIDNLSGIIDRAIKNKIPMLALFPNTNKKLKDINGSEALNEDNLVSKAIIKIKKKYKNKIGIMCDVALDPYTSHGHDGLLKKNEILNDETINIKLVTNGGLSIDASNQLAITPNSLNSKQSPADLDELIIADSLAFRFVAKNLEQNAGRN